MNITRFSIKQPVLVNLVTIGLFVAGLLAWRAIPREIFPSIERHTVTITTLYPGVAPAEVEQLVTIPMETALVSVDDIETITTKSSEGRSHIHIEMKEDVKDANRVLMDIQTAIARVSNLPADLPTDPYVRGIRRQIPVMWIALSAQLPEKELRALANDLKTEIEELDGVSEVAVMGIRKVQISIEVDPVKLAAHRLSIAEVMTAVRRKHANVSGGSIRTARGEFLVRTIGRFKGAEAVKRIVVKAGMSGTVRVRDVASVHEGFEERTSESRVYGRPSAYAVVYKKEEADALRVTALVRKHIERTKDKYPEGAGVVLLWDSSKHIQQRQDSMNQNLIMGLLLVVILLFVFLDWRMALMTALGIPIAFFGTFIMMKWLNITINMVTMFALIMVVGMLVDDAIIVVENFYRHLMMGKSRLEAALAGCSEVVWPVLAAVTTTVVAYATLSFLPGRMGQVLKVMPMVVGFALLFSLVEALFILPSHLKEFAKRPKGRAKLTPEQEEELFERSKSGELHKHVPEGIEEGALEARWFKVFQGAFRWLLSGVVRLWYVSFPVAFAIVIGVTMWIWGSTPFVRFPQTTGSQFDIAMELSVGTKLDKTVESVRILEKKLASFPKSAVDSYICDVGQIRLRRRQNQYGTHLAKCQVRLAKDGKGSMSAQQILKQLRPVIANLPGLENFEVALMRSGPETGEPIQVQIRGNDERVIEKIANDVITVTRTVPGVRDVRHDLESGKRELQIIVDEEKAAQLGLDVTSIGTAVRNAFGGGLATRLQRGEDEIDVVVRFPDSLRTRTSDIEALNIRTPTGALVPFKAVARIQEGVGPSTLTRVDRKRTVTVYGAVDDKVTNPSKANRKLATLVQGVKDRYPGYEIKLRGEEEEGKKLQEGIKHSFYLALLVIFIILATIFRSVLQPLIIFLAIPFGAFGVLVGLKVHGLPISLIGLLGAVALLGIVVNDSLVLVDFVNKARRAGQPLLQAAIDAGTKRLRPIILTSVTTIAGLLPMAMGWFGAEEFLKPMAITILWGLVFSTLGTLFVVPCGVMLFDTVRRTFMLLMPNGETEVAKDAGEIPSYLDVAIMALLFSAAMSSFVGALPAVVGIFFAAMTVQRKRVRARSVREAEAAGVEGESLAGMEELDDRIRQASGRARLACVVAMAVNVGMLVLSLLWKYMLSSYF